MKFIIVLLLSTISLKSFCQRPNRSDSIGYETWTYLERIDSSGLPWQTKNELQFIKLRPYIERDPKSGYSYQFVRLCKYLDSAKVNILDNIYDTSLKRKMGETINCLRKRANLRPGDIFPQLILNDSTNHRSKVSDLKGKIIFIDLWASWCTNCRKEMPALIKIYAKYKSKGLIIVPISMDDNKEKWIKAVAHDSMPWKQYCDLVDFDANKLYKDWGIDAIPYNFLIDRNGRLIDKELSMEQLEKILNKL